MSFWCVQDAAKRLENGRRITVVNSNCLWLYIAVVARDHSWFQNKNHPNQTFYSNCIIKDTKKQNDCRWLVAKHTHTKHEKVQKMITGSRRRQSCFLLFFPRYQTCCKRNISNANSLSNVMMYLINCIQVVAAEHLAIV